MSVFKYRNGEKGLKILADLEMPLAASNELNDKRKGNSVAKQ